MEDQRPIRLAVLGGDSTGKSSWISRLTVNIVHEVHYPTRKQANWLFDFIPHSTLAKTILDRQAHERILQRTQGSQEPEPLFSSPSITPHILLSPLVFQSFINDFAYVRSQYKNRSTNHIKSITLKSRDTPFYQYMAPDKDLIDEKLVNTITNSNVNILRSISSSTSSISPSRSMEDPFELPANYIPPRYTPISIDIVDTPGFNPDMVVPFLEVSLFTRLDKRVLRGLADEPRQPVSTTSMLVASGASELNAKIDGYIFVYSAVPELNQEIDPPEYNDIKNSSQNTGSDNDTPVLRKDSWSSYNKMSDGGFSLLEIMRNCILDAWTEFRDHERRWEMGKEGDVYSFVYNFKSMWKAEKQRRTKLAELRSFNQKLSSLDLDPSSPDSPPPCLIICTHLHDAMASPVLVEWGRSLATKWKCGYVALDNMDDYNVDVATSLIIREIVEKNKLLSSKSI